MRKRSRMRAVRAIARLHGILKPKDGERPFTEWWAEYKAAERALEES